MENVEEPKPRVSKLAIGSLICALFSIVPFFGIFLGVLAIILGSIACYKISRNVQKLRGKSLAITGIIIGSLFLIINVYSETTMFIRSSQKGKPFTAKTEINSTSTALEGYYRDIGHYPSTENGLVELEIDSTNNPKWGRSFGGAYIEFRKKNRSGIPLDSWGHEYRYTSDGKSFTILSYGADGKPGGTGFAADISKTVTAKEK